MPDLVKIGYSTKDPILRAKELNHTGTPHPYQVVYDVLVINPKDYETQIHSQCKIKREGKEWFRLSIGQAIKVVRDVVRNDILLEKIHIELADLNDPDDDEGDQKEPNSYKMCQFSMCDDKAVKSFGGSMYCIWHYRQQFPL